MNDKVISYKRGLDKIQHNPNELPPKDIIGVTNEGLIAYVFNVGRPDEMIRLYRPDEAEKIANILQFTTSKIMKDSGRFHNE